LTLAPSTKNTSEVNHWKITSRAAGSSTPFVTEISGQAPWSFTIPLTANVDNEVEVSASAPSGNHGLFPPYSVRTVRVESLP
jgi:hypothetical protein